MRLKSAAARRGATILSFACIALLATLWRVSPRDVDAHQRKSYGFKDNKHKELHVPRDLHERQLGTLKLEEIVDNSTKGELLFGPISSPSRDIDARSTKGFATDNIAYEKFSRPPLDSARHKLYTNHWHDYELTEEELVSAHAELCSIASQISGTGVQQVVTDKLQLLSRQDLKHCNLHSRMDALKNGKYCSDALEIFHSGYPFDRILISFGDITPETRNLPFFVKSRLIGASRNGILWPLNTKRHFGNLGDVSLKDTPWEKKLSRVVWRGADTGRGTRAKVVESFFDQTDRDVDIALTIVLEYGKKGLTRPVLSMQELLRHKYLLSLEGNDVASGLKWMLLSSSVVFMPTPKSVSWASESLLIPYIHYVPVAADLSNLIEQLAWAKENDEVCQNISRAATRFMEKFVGYSSDAAAEQDVNLKIQVITTAATVMDQIIRGVPAQSCAFHQLLKPDNGSASSLPIV